MGFFNKKKKEPVMPKEVEQEVQEEPEEKLICPFCNTRIDQVEIRELFDEDDEEYGYLLGCPNCMKILGTRYDY